MLRINPKSLSLSNSQIINSLTYIFFGAYFVIGIKIYKDYGITTDEPFQRTSGYYWYLWVINNFFSDYANFEFLKTNFSKMEWSQEFKNGLFLEYGVIFDLFAVFIEDIFNLENVYQKKHLLNFLIFFSSSVCFFQLIKYRFKDNFLSFIGVLFYITSPRIFAESFYNSKDIIFMSFTLFAVFFAIKLLKNYKIKNIILFSLFAALATDVRTMGIFLILLFVIFFILECLEENSFLKNNFTLFSLLIFSYFLFMYLFWPHLWLNPLDNFLASFQSFKNYSWGGSVLYLGEYVSAQHLPWHYSLVWIAITLPIIYSLLFVLGSFKISFTFFNNFLNIDPENLSKKLWYSHNDKIDLFILMYFLVPIVAIIAFGSTLYNGWRHLYFIYPALVYISIFGIKYILSFIFFFFFKYLFFSIFFIFVFINFYNLIKFHPYQNVYFNYLVEKKANYLFEVDYWGSGNAHALKKILKDAQSNKKINVGTASFTPLSYSKYIINDKKIENINFLGNDQLNNDYIFTNYMYENDPKISKKYLIPHNYEKVFTLKRGNIIINEVFKKK